MITLPENHPAYGKHDNYDRLPRDTIRYTVEMPTWSQVFVDIGEALDYYDMLVSCKPFDGQRWIDFYITYGYGQRIYRTRRLFFTA